MKTTRVFFYSGNIDDKYKEEAKKSLIDARWIPIQELSGVLQPLECTGPERHTCTPRAEFPYAIIAERDE
jgi:hypothetical protein